MKMDKKKQTKRKTKQEDLVCAHLGFVYGKETVLSSNSLCFVVCAVVCISLYFAFIVVLVISMGESNSFQQWLHSFWPTLGALGGRETVNKPELAASPRVTQQPRSLCAIITFFMYNVKIRRVTGANLRTDLFLFFLIKKEKKSGLRPFRKLTSSRLCKWCCVPRRPETASSSEPIRSTSIWTLFSSKMPLVLARFWRCCRNATRPESRNQTEIKNDKRIINFFNYFQQKKKTPSRNVHKHFLYSNSSPNSPVMDKSIVLSDECYLVSLQRAMNSNHVLFNF